MLNDEKCSKPKKTIFQSIRNNLTPSRIRKELPLKKRSDSETSTSESLKRNQTIRTRSCSIGNEIESIDFVPRFKILASGFISLGKQLIERIMSRLWLRKYKKESNRFDSIGNFRRKMLLGAETDFPVRYSITVNRLSTYFRFGCNYSILRKFRSFLTISDNTQPLWTRFWAVMKNDKLSLWQYPDDEDSKDYF